LEPHFFNVEEVSRRRSSRTSQDSTHKITRFSPVTGTTPRSREGVSIPPRMLKDHSRASPEMYFRVGSLPTKPIDFDQRSINSLNYVPFTPPVQTTAIPLDWAESFGKELPPFSSSSPQDANKFILNKPDILGSSPPFAVVKKEVIDLFIVG
jgi:hypothetical protein